MKLYRLCRIQTLPVSEEVAWQFFSSPLNLPSITPPWLKLKITGDVSKPMYPGMLICYRLAPFWGIPVKWLSEITHVDPPRYFVDEQRAGPYRFWHHQHHFRPENGRIKMTDTVSFAFKYGHFGSLLYTLFIRKRLADIFDYRKERLAQLFFDD